uniref:Uncharacterized protein n=1 Tax=Panagrolaimus sp. PS1159 TaxID=55785 RepID=A0AC35FSS0_9BILA
MDYSKLKTLIEEFGVDKNGKVICSIQSKVDKKRTKLHERIFYGSLRIKKAGSSLLLSSSDIEGSSCVRKRSKSPISRIIKSRTFSGLRNLVIPNDGIGGGDSATASTEDLQTKTSRTFWNPFRNKTPKKVQFYVEPEQERG